MSHCAVALDELAVAPELAARAQVLDEVPVDRALVRRAREGVARAYGEMDRAVDLLVEERVSHVPRDPGIAADPELAEPPRALVRIENREQMVFAVGRARSDDDAAPELEPRAGDVAALVDRRELGERDDALGRVLHRPEEELARRHVAQAVVDRRLPTLDRERQIGLGADDPDLARPIEALGVAAQPLVLGVPVAQAGAVDVVLELGQRHPGLCRRRLGGELRHRPADVERPAALRGSLLRALDQPAALGLEIRTRMQILGRDDREPRVLVLDGVRLDLGQLREQLERRLTGPIEVDA